MCKLGFLRQFQDWHTRQKGYYNTNNSKAPDKRDSKQHQLHSWRSSSRHLGCITARTMRIYAYESHTSRSLHLGCTDIHASSAPKGISWRNPHLSWTLARGYLVETWISRAGKDEEDKRLEGEKSRTTFSFKK